MKWALFDSLYCAEQWFCCHLESTGNYLREAGEQVAQIVTAIGGDRGRPLLGVVSVPAWDFRDEPDVAFFLDDYDRARGTAGRVKLAQVAARCSTMPWEVRSDGRQVFSLCISSIPAMVEESRAAGLEARFQPLCFDSRALVCGMGVRERDIDCLFVGTVDSNHQKRAAILRELGDLVTVMPPTFGRDYYRLLARAKTVINIHAEWAKGAQNALRIFEATGMGSICVTDGEEPGLRLPGYRIYQEETPDEIARVVRKCIRDADGMRSQTQGYTLSEHGYHNRIPQLIEWARSL